MGKEQRAVGAVCRWGQVNLGWLLECGGSASERTEAVAWYSKAAAANDSVQALIPPSNQPP